MARQREQLPLLERRLGVAPYSYWMGHHRRPKSGWRVLLGLRGPQAGRLGEWRWWFHGWECDFQHRHDGRSVRVDFGPDARGDVFTGWGVLQFVRATRPPWLTFPDLQAHLAGRDAFALMRRVEDACAAHGWLGPCAPELVGPKGPGGHIELQALRLSLTPAGRATLAAWGPREAEDDRKEFLSVCRESGQA